jgi:branched-subunit amino acid ABC-type transport system permease component
MSSPSIKLYRLRGIFVVYFVLKSLAGAVVASIVLRQGNWGRVGKWEFPPGAVLTFSLMATAVILAVAWLVFCQLLQRKNWARVLLLVIGWLTVISAVFSLLASSQVAELGSWISQWIPEMEWEKLLRFDRVQKVFELLFWGYLISVLQFDNSVRDEFFSQPPVEKTPAK